MTTKNSPDAELRAQATEIASLLKAPDARSKSKDPSAGVFKVAIAMDDGIRFVVWSWEFIANHSHGSLVEAILWEMKK